MDTSWGFGKPVYQEAQSKKASNANHSYKQDNGPVSTEVEVKNTLCDQE